MAIFLRESAAAWGRHLSLVSVLTAILAGKLEI